MTGTGDYQAYPMGSSTSPAVVLRLDVSAVKAGKRAVIGCEHRRIILYGLVNLFERASCRMHE